MSYKRLGKAMAIVLAATLVMQTTVVYGAEDDSIIEEMLADDDYLVIEDVDDSEDAEDITVEGEDEVPYEESYAEDFSDDEIPDDDINIESDEEENSDFELNEAEEEFWDEDSNEDEFEEIAVESEEENAEKTVTEVDVSGNHVLDTDVERNELKASSENPIEKMEIYCGLEKTEANISNYSIKYTKNGELKSAALTLGTSYTSLELKAVQTRKDGTKAKDVPRWEAKKNSIVTVSGSGSSITIKAVSKGKTKIVCYAGDGSGKKKEVKIEVRQAVKELEINGQDYIAKGAKAKFKAIAYPKNANNQNVTWALDKEYKGVSINNSNGELKVAKDVELGTKITLVAKANDFGGAVAKKTIIVKEKATSITLKASEATTIATKAIGDLKTKVSMEASTDNKETVAWKLSDYKIASISVQDNKATVTALAPGDVKVTAYANDGSGKKVEKKIKIIQPVTNIEIIGGAYAPIGGKNRYKTVITPSNASKKDIVWTLEKKIDGVKINPENGELKIDKNVEPGHKVKIRATAKDSNAVYAEKQVVIKEKVKQVTITPMGSTTLGTQAIGDLQTSINLEARTDNNEIVRWEVDNSNSAKVVVDGNIAKVTALAEGTLKLSAKSDDGTNKKAEIKISIIVPVSSLALTVPADRLDNLLASGGELQFTPVFGEKYGNPSEKKVKWQYEIVGYADKKSTKEKEIPIDDRRKIMKKKYFFTLNNGKVTAVDQAKYKEQGIDLWDTCKCNNYGIKVTATTTDGTNLSVTKLIKRVDRNTYIRMYVGADFELSTGEENLLPIRIYGEHDLNKLYVVNKREDIALVTVDDNNHLKIKGRSKGKVRVTIKTMDGSNLKLNINITVK